MHNIRRMHSTYYIILLYMHCTRTTLGVFFASAMHGSCKPPVASALRAHAQSCFFQKYDSYIIFLAYSTLASMHTK